MPALSDAAVPAPGRAANAPTGLARMLRAAAVLAAAWALLVPACTVLVVVALLAWPFGLGWRYGHLVVRPVGRAMLAISGVRLRVVHPERLAGRHARILTLNHTSQLDLWVMCAAMPEAGTAIGKRELLYVPFIGLAFAALGHLLVDRGDSEKARASIARAGALIRRRRATVVIAPEGTRSPDGALAPFKMGAFHLALASRAPILPAVIRGAAACQPKGRLVPDPGTVELELLEPVATDSWTEAELHARRDELRARYAAALA